MSEVNKCPSCGADLRDEAKFCDSCGKPLATEMEAGAAVAAPAPAKPGVNWTGVLLVLVIIVVAGWLLFGPKGDKAASGGGDAISNPHASGSMGGGDSTNPHGAQAGMEGLTATLNSAKAALEEDPLNRDALMTLYQNYGMIGRQAQVKPYLDNAIAAMEAKADELGDKLVETGMNIGLAALLGNEPEGALEVYRKLDELKPNTPEVVVMLGDVSAALDKFEDAVKYYDQYLADATQEAGDQYWGAVINRAVALRMRFEQAEAGMAQQVWLDEAIAGLEMAATAKPDVFAPVYNLGVAYGVAGQKDKALATLAMAKPLAKDAQQEWQVAAEVAKLNGEEPPPAPEMGSMDMSGMEGMGSAEGMPNPHGGSMGGGMGSAEGMPNPHGGSMGGGEGMANPHGG